MQKAILGAATIGVFLLAGCSGTTNASDAVPVRLWHSTFIPANLTIEVGTTVEWTNEDEMGHTVTPTDKAWWGTEGSGDEVKDWLYRGDTWSFTFTNEGRFEYYCVPHVFTDAEGNQHGMVAGINVTKPSATA